jgi:predicted metal-dependent HD superfamily phosphohydrolase
MAGSSGDRSFAIRFGALWERCARDAAKSEGTAVFERLVTAYAERQRHYHTLMHIEQCLSQFDLSPADLPFRDEIEMALWFHDAIYTPGASDNERLSADLFLHLAGASMPRSFTARVEDLIMATTHGALPATPEACWVTDIDLSSFGLPWPEFIHDSRNVRAERVDLADAQFYPAQARFLRSLINRSPMFQTEFFKCRLEAIARTNITRLLSLIEAGKTFRGGIS